MEASHTSLKAKEFFSIPSTVHIVHECFHQEIKFYNWVGIFLFNFIFWVCFFFFLSGTIFIDLKSEKHANEYIFLWQQCIFLSIFLFKI